MRQSPAPNASCSEDLRAAASLARSLRGGPAPAAPAEAGGPTYTSLSRKSPALETRPIGSVMGSTAWAQLLRAFAARAGARHAFVVDAAGLAVAEVGEDEAWHAESMGSRLAIALEQAARMTDRPCRHLSVDLDGLTLTGIRIPQPEGEALTLGLLSALPVSEEALSEILAALGSAGT